MGTASRWPRRHPLLAAWVLLAFCVRALVPAGYMPGHGGLMPCPSAGPVPASAVPLMDMPSMQGMDMSAMDASAMAMHGMHHHALPQGAHAGHGGGTGNEHSCPYASAVAQLAPGHDPAPAAWLAFVSSDVAPAHDVPLPRAPIPCSRLPRGPPASA